MATKRKPPKQVLDDLYEGGVTPVEVMMKSMRYLYAQSEDANAEANELLGYDDKVKDREAILRYGKDCLREACDIAKDVAPYFHPRLQATQVSGDDEKPPVQVEVSTVSELRKFIRGGQ